MGALRTVALSLLSETLGVEAVTLAATLAEDSTGSSVRCTRPMVGAPAQTLSGSAVHSDPDGGHLRAVAPTRGDAPGCG